MIRWRTAVGLGVTEPGRLLLACGTAWVFTGVSTAVQPATLPALDWNFHAVPDRWTISQSLGGLGRSLEWWLGEAWRGVGQTAPRAAQLQSLDAELAQTEPNDGLFFLPLTGGHREPATTEKGALSACS
jgi:sugar (pentulose or hexulose) kinase